MPPRINLPPFTRALLLALFALSALNIALRFRKWTTMNASLSPADRPSALDGSNYLSNPQWANAFLVVVPVKSIIFPWTALTAAFVENNGVSMAISAAVIWFGGRYLERAWGSKEFAKFLLFTTMLPNILAFVVYALWHAVIYKPLFPTPIQGLVAVEAGFLVALKQLVPEHTVSILKGLVRMRVKHFPAVFVLANMLSGPLLGTDTAFWLSLFGFATSWIYLRFFRISEITSSATGGQGATMKGDASDTFAFVAFFPDVMHPILGPMCDVVFDALVQLRLCAPFSDNAVEMSNMNAELRSEGLPSTMDSRVGGGRRAEAERRRALALKALDQRLNAAASASRTVNAAQSTNAGPSFSGDVSDVATTAEPEELTKQAQA